MFDIVRYTPEHAVAWNQFVAQSKNGTFLFDRRYMDYHADRFADHSLLVMEKGRLYALLPGNDDGRGTWWSHQGLTYGGLVMGNECRAATVRTVLMELNDYLSAAGFRHVVYKHVPWIYARQPSEEDLFALTNVCRATLRTRDVASVVDLHSRLPMSTLRRRGIKKAEKGGLHVEETTDFAPYWQLLEANLQQRFHARPVHTLDEISLLHSRFPDAIRLVVVKKGGELLGGTVLYVSGWTVKTQYISANEEGKHTGAIDCLFDQLLRQSGAAGFRYFDFGTSNLTTNDDLNEPLIFQKEGFGGRAVCYDSYEWTL